MDDQTMDPAGSSRLAEDLLFAAENTDVRLVAELLAAGADPNVKDLHGQTPLHCSIDAEVEGEDELGFVGIGTTHVLLAFGADPRIPTNKGETPLDWAVKRNHDHAVRLIGHFLSKG